VPTAKVERNTHTGKLRTALREQLKANGNTGTMGKIKDGPCPVCEFKTEPLHDARLHFHKQTRRRQKKRPFTNDELGKMGYAKV
jgi:hypothetical protein